MWRRNPSTSSKDSVALFPDAPTERGREASGNAGKGGGSRTPRRCVLRHTASRRRSLPSSSHRRSLPSTKRFARRQGLTALRSTPTTAASPVSEISIQSAAFRSFWNERCGCKATPSDGRLRTAFGQPTVRRTGGQGTLPSKSSWALSLPRPPRGTTLRRPSTISKLRECYLPKVCGTSQPTSLAAINSLRQATST